jgi:hypothetical protein
MSLLLVSYDEVLILMTVSPTVRFKRGAEIQENRFLVDIYLDLVFRM